MRYIPVVAMLLALVAVMGGMSGNSARATGNLVLVIVGFVLLTLLFGLVLNRTL